MRLMYGAPPRPGSLRDHLLEGEVHEDIFGPPVDPPPAHATDEVSAFNTIAGALGMLSVEQRRRVLRAVAALFGLTVT
jgi:hypothetical protein